MKLTRVFVALFLLAAVAGAQTLTGVVRNGTTSRPSAGDDVILLELSQGMNEVARTQTDPQGRFSLTIPNATASHLVRVNHQNVNYFRPAPPGATSVEVEVFDVAAKVEGVSAVVDILRLQADANSLQVVEVFGVKNDSQPPRTWMAEQTVELVLPRGAKLQSSLAASASGMPVNSPLVPLDDQGRHAFVFPIRPGETRFQISYSLPYTGEASFAPRLKYPVEHLVVILPKSMELEAASPQAFQQTSEEEGAMVHVATAVKPGAEPRFRVRGVGQLTDLTQAAAGGGGQSAGQPSGPGGGLGPPSSEPDPLQQYRWHILGGIAAALALGAVLVLRRPARPAELHAVKAETAGRAAGAAPLAARPRADRAAGTLDALKEELFLLEVDRHEGRISQQEYEKSRAALDHTLGRALARRKSAG